jgi:hypothetical protein
MHALTSAVAEGGRYTACLPAALLPGKEPPLPIRQEAEWAPESVWMQ